MSKARELAELGAVYDSGALSNRNIIINGAMRVAQRGTSFSGSTGVVQLVDRWHTPIGTSFNLDTTITQSTTVPTGEGFMNSLKVEADSVVTPSGGENGGIGTKFEGNDLKHLAYGSSSAKSVTLSFWVRSNKTGIYCCQLQVNQGSGNSDQYGQVKEYTISSANTWEKKTLTFSGLTAQAITSTTTDGLRVLWWLACGSSDHVAADTWIATANYGATSNQVNFMDSASNEWYLTGCQLEVGTEATPFEHRSFGDEFQSCQRYFSKSYRYDKYAGDTSSLGWVQTEFHENNQGAGYREYYAFPFAVRMRATPTITIYDTAGNAGKCNYYISVGSGNTNKVLNVSSTNERTFGGYSDRATSIGGWACHYTADAEL